jgi:Glycine cleavage system H protein (lipoate-binding)
VVARNEALEKSPELVNTDPFGKGWLVRVKLASPGEVAALMDAAAYTSYLATL